MEPEIQQQVEQVAQQLEQKAAAEKALIEKEAQARVLAALKSRLGLA